MSAELLNPSLETDLSTAELEILPPPPPPTRNYRRALGLLRRLGEDPTQTDLGMQMVEALGGFAGDESFQQFAADPEGRRMLREKPCLVSRVADREALSKLPDGSFGRAYLDFALRNGFSADGLIKLGKLNMQRPSADPLRAWFGDRMSVAHDLQHVLTGYGTDPIGELALLQFTRGQGVRGPALRMLTTLSLLRGSWAVKRFALQARRRGRRSSSMALAPFEELLPQPLLRVRDWLGLGQTQDAHPAGILQEVDDEVVRVATSA